MRRKLLQIGTVGLPVQFYEARSIMRNRDLLVIDDLSTAVEVLSNRIFRVDHPFRTTRRIFGASVLDTEGNEHSRRKRSWMQLFRRSEMEGPVESIISSAVDRGFCVREGA